MTTPINPSVGEYSQTSSSERVRTGIIIALLGLFIFAVGAKPSWFGWDRSQVVGFVQIAVFLLGLGIICIGGCVSMLAYWKGKQRSIPADIGLRLVSTGFIVCLFAGMADVFGMGSQVLPEVPYFGPLQAGGVMIGEIIIALGFLFMIPYTQAENKLTYE